MYLSLSRYIFISLRMFQVHVLFHNACSGYKLYFIKHVLLHIITYLGDETHNHVLASPRKTASEHPSKNWGLLLLQAESGEGDFG